MVHLLSQLDPMVWLMMIVVAVGFVVAALVLVDLLPGDGSDDDAAARAPRTPKPVVEPVPTRRQLPEAAASGRSGARNDSERMSSTSSSKSSGNTSPGPMNGVRSRTSSKTRLVPRPRGPLPRSSTA